MAFNSHLLDRLDYDKAEPLLDEYIPGVLEAFANSKTGEAQFTPITGDVQPVGQPYFSEWQQNLAVPTLM
ncbi:hypothetical protein C7271_14960 [filamentous cyanobacterium CCP5]|nr:hypothetical protein C7271_14960 [filamentous cyanobacterium CCP5]